MHYDGVRQRGRIFAGNMNVGGAGMRSPLSV